jgi:hypothetical protein
MDSQMTGMAYTQRALLDFTKFAQLTKSQKHFEIFLRYKEDILANCLCCAWPLTLFVFLITFVLTVHQSGHRM